jgi:hypothetical protein
LAEAAFEISNASFYFPISTDLLKAVQFVAPQNKSLVNEIDIAHGVLAGVCRNAGTRSAFAGVIFFVMLVPPRSHLGPLPAMLL